MVVALLLFLAGRAERRRQAGRLELLAELAAALRDEEGVEVAQDDEALAVLRVAGHGELPLDLDRLRRIGDGPAGARERRRLLAIGVELLRRHAGSLAGELDLKLHGPRILPRLVPDDLFELLPTDAGIPRVAVPGLGLSAIAVIEGGEGFPFVTERHLESLGIDPEGLHGVALAVLRQRFEPALIRRVVERGETVTVEAPEGLAASRLLLLPENLRRGEAVLAWQPAPGTLVIAPDGEPPDRARGGGPASPVLPVAVRVTGDGFERLAHGDPVVG